MAWATDPATGRVFVIEGEPGTLTAIDPRTDRAIGTITVGEKMEYAAADGAGHLFVAGEALGDLVVVDTRTLAVTAHYAMPDCRSPHGLAYDARHARVFMGCANERMMIVDAASGRVVATVPIGKGSDAIAFDPTRGRVFSANGRDGTVSAYQQVTADRYEALPTIATSVGARNMAVDARSGRLFVIGADFDPPIPPATRGRARAGTVRVSIYAPVG